MVKKKTTFASFEESERENLEDSLKRTVQERLDYLEQLQKIYYELKKDNNLQEFQEPNEEYILLKRKNYGTV